MAVILDSPVGPSIITRILIVEKGDRSECHRVSHCEIQLAIAGLKDGERL